MPPAPDVTPVDETGQPLTDAEIAALIRHRPVTLMIIVAHPDDDIDVSPHGAIVTHPTGSSGGRPGRVVVSRAAITAATTAED